MKITIPFYDTIAPGDRVTKTTEPITEGTENPRARLMFPQGTHNKLAVSFWVLDTTVSDNVNPAKIGGVVLSSVLAEDYEFKGEDTAYDVYLVGEIPPGRRIAVSANNESNDYEKVLNCLLELGVQNA